MPVEQLATRLEDRFRILTGGSRTALPRQQTLRALIDWSYDLLDENQKTVLHAVSVFAGGWTLESGEAVCTGERIDSWEVLELLTALCDKSLVVYEEVAGEARYRLLESIRQYARDRLVESGASEVFRDRHLAYYLALVEEAEPHLRGAKQRAWLERLEREHDNLRAALEWSTKSPEGIESSLRFSSAVWLFWLMRGYLTEGWELLARVRTVGIAGDAVLRARVLGGAGALAYALCDYVSAQALYEESLALRRELGDRGGMSLSLGNLGDVAVAEGNYASARALFEESLALRRALGDRRGLFMLLYGFAALATALEAPLTAARLWGAAQELFEEFGASLPTYKRERYLQPVTTARSRAGEEAFAAAWAEGQVLTLEEAFALAQDV